MGCGGSSGTSGPIKMKKTKLEELDEFFDDVQGLIDEIYELKDPVEEARGKLLESTELAKVTCGNTHHAIVGIVFAIASQLRGGEIGNIFTITIEAPFIEINSESATGRLIESIDALKEYIESIIGAKDRIEPLVQKVTEFVKKAPELPNKAKEGVSSAKGLGLMDQINAVKNTATNCRNLTSLPSLINEFKQTVQNTLAEIQGATKELNEVKSKLSEISKKCSAKNLTSPKECYLECGKPIKVTPEAKKEWDKKNKSKKPIKGAKGAKGTKDAKGNTRVEKDGVKILIKKDAKDSEKDSARLTRVKLD
jgi:hypothetical protein